MKCQKVGRKRSISVSGARLRRRIDGRRLPAHGGIAPEGGGQGRRVERESTNTTDVLLILATQLPRVDRSSSRWPLENGTPIPTFSLILGQAPAEYYGPSKSEEFLLVKLVALAAIECYTPGETYRHFPLCQSRPLLRFIPTYLLLSITREL